MYTDQFGVNRYTEFEILNFIKRFQNEGTVKTFTEGCCYWFAKILDERFNEFDYEPQICYNPKENHFATLINFHLYDITGDLGEMKDLPDWKYWDKYQYKEDEKVFERLYRDCINF